MYKVAVKHRTKEKCDQYDLGKYNLKKMDACNQCLEKHLEILSREIQNQHLVIKPRGLG